MNSPNERTVLDAATALTRRKPHRPAADKTAIMLEVLAGAAEAGVAAIKDGRLVQLRLILVPTRC